MKVVIDRFEGGFAVVELEKNRWANIPKALIPNAREGDIISIEVLKDESLKNKKKLSEKLESLFDDEN